MSFQVRRTNASYTGDQVTFYGKSRGFGRVFACGERREGEEGVSHAW